MSDFSIIYICLGISAALLFTKLLTSGFKDLITPLCLFYFYFAFGPVISYVSGGNIYFGIPKEYIPQACIIFTIALSTMIIGSMLWPTRNISDTKFKGLNLNVLFPVYLFSILYALYVIVMVIFTGSGSKIDKISLANPLLHYNYLLIQLYLISFYFLVKDGPLKKLFYTNSAFYILYSLAIGERDFIFPVISIVFHRFLFQSDDKRSKIKLFISVIVMTGVATSIFFLRDATQSSASVLEAILNQGSLLFVNTFSLKLLHERINYFFGYTYLNSFMNLLPSWIFKTDFNTLDWFKNNYAAASTSGYGYGLDAEGYINFSYLGVILTFLLLLIFQRKIVKHLETHPFFIYYSVFFSSFTMYSLRNDSLAFIKGNLYATIFFFVIYKLSWKKALP